MAETPPLPPMSTETDSEPVQYWCYHCEKRVSVETLSDLPDVICHECKNGFVESIVAPVPPPPSPPPTAADRGQEPSFSRQFLQVLRLIAQAARNDAATPPPADPVSDPSETDDFLRIELDGWDNTDDDNDFDADDIDFGNFVGDRSDREDRDEEDPEHFERERLRRRRDTLRLRIRDLATRAASGRNRILDWSDILMGLDDNTIELRVEMPESDGYVGNREDYIDAGGYEALLQDLAESDEGARRGAPPASRSAVSALQTVEIMPGDEALICAICKELVPVGKTAKRLPCGHGYHGDCIFPWLGSRNSCPVCRFELPTDDREYEEEKKKKNKSMASSATAGGSSNSGY